MILAAATPSTTAHAANAQAEQWRDEAAQWALQTARWNSFWTWEIITTIVLLILLGVLLWQNAELKKLVTRILNRT